MIVCTWRHYNTLISVLSKQEFESLLEYDAAPFVFSHIKDDLETYAALTGFKMGEKRVQNDLPLNYKFAMAENLLHRPSMRDRFMCHSAFTVKENFLQDFSGEEDMNPSFDNRQRLPQPKDIVKIFVQQYTADNAGALITIVYCYLLKIYIFDRSPCGGCKRGVVPCIFCGSRAREG